MKGMIHMNDESIKKFGDGILGSANFVNRDALNDISEKVERLLISEQVSVRIWEVIKSRIDRKLEINIDLGDYQIEKAIEETKKLNAKYSH